MFNIVNRMLCGMKSPLGDLAEILTVGAQHCWCCSFWRGVLLSSLFWLGLYFIGSRI